MTNDEAIELLLMRRAGLHDFSINPPKSIDLDKFKNYVKALDMAVDALSLPTYDPSTHVAVPREITKEMFHVLWKLSSSLDVQECVDTYQSMLAAYENKGE
jgi:hypothetical protein